MTRHLRDAARICPAVSALSSGYVLNRCELDRGHEGRHKDGCTYWSTPIPVSQSRGAVPDAAEE